MRKIYAVMVILIAGLITLARSEEEKKEEFILSTKALKFSIYGQLQMRTSFEENDSNANRGAETDAFGFRRLRLEFKGDLTKETGFFVRTELKGTNTQLLDANIIFNYKPFPTVYFGSFMTVPSMESNTSIKSLDTLDRANIVDAIRSFEPGIKIQGNLLDKKLSYDLSVTNGNGNYTQSNDNDQYFCADRITYRVLENTQLGPEKLNLIVGMSNGYSYDSATRADALFNTKSTLGVTSRGKRNLEGAEINIGYGAFTLKSEYIKTWFNPGKEGLRNIYMDGYYVQGTCFIIPDKLRSVIKYETFDPDREVNNYKDINWTTLGLTWLVKKDDFKIEANYILKNEARDEFDNDALLLQLQLLF